MARDPQVMSGDQDYEHTRCTCSHQKRVHAEWKGACGVGECGCVVYIPSIGRECETCGAWLSPQEVARLDG
jgi:hypothetical protein